METTEGRLHLATWDGVASGPNLAGAGPGSYRLRLSVRGRDSTDGGAEHHQLQIWRAPFAATWVVKQSSAFSERWGVTAAPRVIDWETLASTTGRRLVVGWAALTPPPGTRSPVEVTVSAVIEGKSPADLLSRFAYGNPAGMCSGGGGT